MIHTDDRILPTGAFRRLNRSQEFHIDLEDEDILSNDIDDLPDHVIDLKAWILLYEHQHGKKNDEAIKAFISKAESKYAKVEKEHVDDTEDEFTATRSRFARRRADAAKKSVSVKAEESPKKERVRLEPIKLEKIPGKVWRNLDPSQIVLLDYDYGLISEESYDRALQEAEEVENYILKERFNWV